MAANTILLIEDDPDDEELTLRALARHHIGTQIVVARNCPLALDWLGRTTAPALILLGMTPAPDVLRSLQSSNIPVVIVQKPVNASALADVVANLAS